MSDPLSQYRKTPVAPAGQISTPSGEDEYVAFDAKDRVERLKVRRANAPTHSPGYVFLVDVAYDGTFGTNFVLQFSFMTVFVTGKNLQNVVAALEMSTAAFIQEFDPDRWPKPKDEKAPFIESIEVVMQERPSSAGSEESKILH